MVSTPSMTTMPSRQSPARGNRLDISGKVRARSFLRLQGHSPRRAAELPGHLPENTGIISGAVRMTSNTMGASPGLMDRAMSFSASVRAWLPILCAIR